ncbi:ribosome biogenesis protein SLX9 domain-containing protein [Hirsutella rhossiliensis]|uniref:Ribosome biogenesis protein SLX9 n=1 Tax=Hirsutella rhossiliensis TaxID=111463 RepID=A0A9P8MYQ5_9HYPO|nr:ribosome biogenesis protein SLX9 domain-containing protein [Hirsutella rhossiliensis]KAH0962804.1 ribosome biogenesis protein SLX9 domain-containing protein [Hirsutella rhossiliensis]
MASPSPAPVAPPSSAPSARARRLARISGAIHPLAPPKTFRSDAAVTDYFLSTKRDKRLIKHSSFLARVASSSSSSRITKPRSQNRSRRPNNKLKTSLQGLADALPSLQDEDEGADEDRRGELRHKVRHRSIKSKPGALKRKEMVVKGEMERFGVSMARLSGATPSSSTPSLRGGQAQADGNGRWAALRGYISATMEQAPAFVGKS